MTQRSAEQPEVRWPRATAARVATSHPGRRWLFWALVIAATWFLISRYAELEKLIDTLRHGDWRWILVAAGLQAVFFLVYASVYQAAFSTVGVRSRTRELLPVWFASIFINTVAPTAGPVLFIDDAAQRGESASRAAAGTVLVRIADFGTFALILVVGMAYLFLHHNLQPYVVVGAVLLLLLVLGWCALLLLGLHKVEGLQRLLSWGQEWVARLAARAHRPSPLPEDWASRNAREFSAAAAAMATRPRGLGLTLALALTAHLVDLASLYTLFRAFHQNVSLGTLVAGFGVGVLFWIISITPEGIGVVEAVMALVYASLGVPLETATVVALSFRGLTFWLPLGIGLVLLRRIRSFGAEEWRRPTDWEVRLIALATAAMGVVNLISAILPSLRGRWLLLTPYLPGVARHGARLTAVLAGFGLLMVSRNLWRRKRTAWLLTLGLLLISAISHLLKGLDYEEAVLSAMLAAWLWSLRSQFHTRSDPPSVRQGLLTLGAALLFTLVYGTAGFYLLDRHFSVHFDLPSAVRQTLVMFTQFYDPGLEPLTGYGRYFAASIYVVGTVTIGSALLLVFRPLLLRRPAPREERARAEAIVQRYGHSSLARFTLFADKQYFFSPGGSVVAYALEGRCALALGDPIGPPTDIEACIVAFQNHCAHSDWEASFYQTLPDHLALYRTAGFEALHIGDEAIVDLAAFTLDGHANKSLRSAVHKVEHLGYRSEYHEAPQSEALLEELRAVSDEWLTSMHGGEKRFSLGWFEDEYLRSGPVMLVRSPNGTITAFANLIPEYQLNEATIDLMRHRREVAHGTMDFLFVRLLEWAQARGYTSFNLGLSPLAGVGERSEDPAVERALHFIYEHVDRFYNFKGLRQFKAKFHPHWEPRFLIYPGAASLIGVATAVLRADSGDEPIWRYLKQLLRNCTAVGPSGGKAG